MTEKNNIQNPDDFIRQMMQSSKKQAPENLKYRVMQQIETEKALTPQKTAPKKVRENTLKDFKAIFGVMYALLFAFSLFTLVFWGKDALLSTQFILVAALIFVVSGAFWGITRLDAYVRGKKENSSASE